MGEQFQQQEKDFQDELQVQNRVKMEEYRRDCDIATQFALDTHKEKIKMEVEQQYLQKAKVFQKSLSDELEKERSSGIVYRKDRDSMSVFIEAQRAEIEFLKSRPQNQSQDGELILRMKRDIET